MPSDSEQSLQRLDAVVDAPWELAEYESWLSREAASSDDYLFAEPRARFEARDADSLRAPTDLEIRAAKSGIELGSKALGGSVVIAGVNRASAERVLKLVDGKARFVELRLLAGSDRTALERLVQAGLGRVLFVPEAVAALEGRLSGVELVRFVGTPYELVRAYWENMADVRELAENTLKDATDAGSFERWLRRLHVALLLGRDLSNFYRPASKITLKGVRPGALYTSPSHAVESAGRTLLLAGPRVGVALVGGERYHELLCQDDPEALEPSRTITDEDGVPWGRVVTGRALDDAQDAAWFCPPRPLLPEHFAKLWAAYRDAISATERAEPARTAECLSRFHYRFVRLHPFRCANQSLAMNLANLLLFRSHGAGMPHLLLDQLALRLSEPAYTTLFSRAIEAHCLAGEPSERWAKLREKKARSYALIERLKAARDAAEAKQLASAEPLGASAALLAL
jgi:hypothetical protein